MPRYRTDRHSSPRTMGNSYQRTKVSCRGAHAHPPMPLMHAHVQQAQDQQRESLGRRDGPDHFWPALRQLCSWGRSMPKIRDLCRSSSDVTPSRTHLPGGRAARAARAARSLARDRSGRSFSGRFLGVSQLVCLCIYGSTYGMLRPVILSILIRYIVATLPLCPRFFLRLVPCYISRTSSFIQLALYLLCPSVESKGTRNACRIPFVDGELWGTAPPRENDTEARPWSDSV